MVTQEYKLSTIEECDKLLHHLEKVKQFYDEKIESLKTATQGCVNDRWHPYRYEKGISHSLEKDMEQITLRKLELYESKGKWAYKNIIKMCDNTHEYAWGIEHTGELSKMKTFVLDDSWVSLGGTISDDMSIHNEIDVTIRWKDNNIRVIEYTDKNKYLADLESFERYLEETYPRKELMKQ